MKPSRMAKTARITSGTVMTAGFRADGRAVMGVSSEWAFGWSTWPRAGADAAEEDVADLAGHVERGEQRAEAPR